MQDVGSGGSELRDAVDAVYRRNDARYNSAAEEQMVGDDAATSFRLINRRR
jgi:hypothetical protein